MRMHVYISVYEFSCFRAQCSRMTAADNKRGLIYVTTLKRYIHTLVCTHTGTPVCKSHPVHRQVAGNL